MATNNSNNSKNTRTKLPAAERIDRRKTAILSDFEKNPLHSTLVSTEMPQSFRLSSYAREMEEGVKAMRMQMGTSARFTFEQGQVVLDRIDWAIDQVESATLMLNENGFGTGRSVYAIREETQKEKSYAKRVASEGSEEQKKLVAELASLKEKFEKDQAELITKRIEEDRALNEAFEKSLEDIKEKTKIADEKAIEKRRVEKEKEKEARKAEHEKRMAEQKAEKEKRIADAKKAKEAEARKAKAADAKKPAETKETEKASA